MITNSQRCGTARDSQAVVKILVLMLSCFNLAGLFLLLGPQWFSNDTDVSTLDNFGATTGRAPVQSSLLPKIEV